MIDILDLLNEKLDFSFEESDKTRAFNLINDETFILIKDKGKLISEVFEDKLDKSTENKYDKNHILYDDLKDLTEDEKEIKNKFFNLLAKSDDWRDPWKSTAVSMSDDEWDRILDESDTREKDKVTLIKDTKFSDNQMIGLDISKMLLAGLSAEQIEGGIRQYLIEFLVEYSDIQSFIDTANGSLIFKAEFK